MSKETFIHAENNHNILSSNEVRLFNPPKPEEMKVVIWDKEICNGAEWNDFLKYVEDKTKEIDQLKQQLEDEKKLHSLAKAFYDEKQAEFDKLLYDYNKLKQQLAEKDEEIEDWKQKTQTFLNRVSEQNYEIANNNPTQLAIQELERVKILLQNAVNYEGYTFVGIYDAVNNQIKELKGEKDVKD